MLEEGVMGLPPHVQGKVHVQDDCSASRPNGVRDGDSASD